MLKYNYIKSTRIKYTNTHRTPFTRSKEGNFINDLYTLCQAKKDAVICYFKHI